jgi:MerR family transcriptional regulator, heat shock protein HspR
MAERRRADEPEPGVDRVRGVFMISVAADLAGMHPQTLRIYETRGLITPQRSPKNTRLYSQADVARLKRIQELTELGMNLAGVERIFELEGQLERMRRRMDRLERRAEQAQQEMEAEIERVRRSFKRELVLYEPQGEALTAKRSGGDGRSVRIPIQHRRRGEN